MMNTPKKLKSPLSVEIGKQLMSGPTPEHVSDDPYQDDKRIATAYNAYSPSGDVTAEVVYANYGTPKDFAELAAKHISVKGKIVIVRYGKDFRGVKAYVAQQHGAAGIIIYSDPADDGYYQGDIYPDGPYRPESGVQRGSIQYLFKYPGDPTLLASPPRRTCPPTNVSRSPTLPTSRKFLSTPLSYRDAAPILQALGARRLRTAGKARCPSPITSVPAR